MSQVSIILLEKVENLGAIGDVVNVKPGYARNFLLPHSKALRATKDNIAYFESQKTAIEKVNADKRSAAEKEAKKLEGFTATLIRQASEGGQLYGAINARDIAESTSEKDVSIQRGQVKMDQNFKTIGLFNVDIVMHPEVIVTIQLNIARSEDEAKIQLKTGKALVAAADETLDEAASKATTPAEPEVDSSVVEDLLEDSAIELKEEAEEAAAKAKVEEEAKAEERAAKKAEKEAAEAAAAAESEVDETTEAESGDAETAETEDIPADAETKE